MGEGGRAALPRQPFPLTAVRHGARRAAGLGRCPGCRGPVPDRGRVAGGSCQGGVCGHAEAGGWGRPRPLPRSQRCPGAARGGRAPYPQRPCGLRAAWEPLGKPGWIAPIPAVCSQAPSLSGIPCRGGAVTGGGGGAPLARCFWEGDKTVCRSDCVG